MSNLEIDETVVLIVDDCPENLGVLFEHLSQHHMKVLVAQSGKDAIELVNEVQPDIILLDILMPDMDGFATCARLKSNKDTQDIPVIFISALSSTAGKIQGFEVGGIDYINKPFAHQEVLARVQTHLKLRKLQKTVEESEQSFRLCFEHAVDPIFWADEHGIIINCNKAAEQLLEKSRQKIIGHSQSLLHPAEKRDFYSDMFRKHIAKGAVSDEAQVITKSGTIKTVRITAATTCIGDKFIIQGIFHDITLQKQMEIDLQRNVAKLTAANRTKSDFLANMSHEIRTPISGILGIAEMLETMELSQEQHQLVKTILGSGKSLLNIINDILDLSKVENKKIKLQVGDFDLFQQLQELVRVFEVQAQEKNLGLFLNIMPSVTRYWRGDAGRLSQILKNLLANAIKFTNTGKIIVQVDQTEAGELLFAISDTGIGIAQAEQSKLFQPFTQVDSSAGKKYRGTGLGLAICKKLVQMMQGNIWLESEPGRGSTFFFTAKLAKIQSMDKQNASPYPSGSRSCKILLAEDYQPNRKFISHVLAKAGHAVAMAATGQEVLQKLREQSFDLILMDIQMPEVDGIQATQTIRQHDGEQFDPHIPIIALTAYAMKGDRERFLQIGINDYVSKPVNMDELLRTIDRIII